jgi:hypothetical protein
MSLDRHQIFVIDLALKAADAAWVRLAKVLAAAAVFMVVSGWLVHFSGGNPALAIALGALSMSAALLGAWIFVAYAVRCVSIAADVLRLRAASTRLPAFLIGKIWFASVLLDLILRPPCRALHI